MIPVIISGGEGARLWPASSEQHPKPFIRLGDGESLLQKTFLLGGQLSSVNHLNVFARLKELGNETHKSHKTVHRSWGTYTSLEEAQGFNIKRIEVKPNEQLSLHIHHHLSQHWIVGSGSTKVTNGHHILTVNTNESTE